MDVAESSNLTAALPHYSFAYLVTVTSDGQPHAVAVRPRSIGAVLRVDAVGGHSRRNLEAGSAATLLFPAADADGYSLIVDGGAELDGEGMLLSPVRAVLHRSRPRAGDRGRPGCVSDCVELHLPDRVTA